MQMIYVGDDWAEDHHDVELVDGDGRRLARARLPEGLAGISRLHDLIAAHMPASWADLDQAEAAARVWIGIETDRGTWVQALLVAGYQVYAINPVSVARYRERHSTSGAKSDAGDAHVLAEIVRLDHAHHRRVAGDSADAEAIKLVARAHQSLIWDRTRQVLRLRSALREFFPAALQAFDDLAASEALEALDRAPDPDPGHAAVPLPDRGDAAPGRPPRHRGQGDSHPGNPAGPAAASAPPGADRVRGDRVQPGPAHQHPQHRDRTTG
jgi:transposase